MSIADRGASGRSLVAPGRVVAVLGPTNTGKTHFAIERMLAHRSGMIGFPLRLLARENYDRIVREKGRGAVALVTGEEKIVPPDARWFVCTVESMPLDRTVAFLAVDEIQLCADPERGHVFTDRLLHARGTEETMFLGAETIRPLIQRLIPRVEQVSRPRMSSLTYAGHRKLTRLPPRSAVVAFSAAEVYAMAEQIRRQRGGTAVVLGALSPRTRNAQVALYQSGDVDYLVATDAIGMGLNMDVDHVAFARLVKFDGNAPRRLRPNEVAQIAGRAGRHMADGTFGTTDRLGELDPELVLAVETHQFDALKALSWRNADLDFRSPAQLLRSLDRPPPRPELVRAREADDHATLAGVVHDPAVLDLAKSPAAVSLLWEACQIPDFRKVLSDVHTRFVTQVYGHLMRSDRLPSDWVAAQVARLERTEGDIDTLIARLAHTRTWTYVSFRPHWLDDPAHWQERTRAIEDRLSDALHERLTQRFVDKRSAVLVRSLASGRELTAAVDARGEVLVEGHAVGRLEGFRFAVEGGMGAEDARPALSAARRALRDEIARRVRAVEAAPDAAFELAPDGRVLWEGAPVAALAPGPDPLSPRLAGIEGEMLEPPQRDAVWRRLQARVQAEIALVLAPISRLRQVADLPGPVRGIAFQVAEGLGACPRRAVDQLAAALRKPDRGRLAALGIVLGPTWAYVPAVLKPRPSSLKALLWAVWAGRPLPAPVPPPGRVSADPVEGWPAAYWEAVGFPLLGPRAIRIDIAERLERRLHAEAKAGPLQATPQLASSIGASPDDLPAVMEALGWKPVVHQDGETIVWKRGGGKRRAGGGRGPGGGGGRPPARPVDPDHPFAGLKALEGAK
jgi:ATP-dependent RNA helicase SUPV3L1/SUV3